MTEKLIFSLEGLRAGRTTEKCNVGLEFFHSFENTEILDADLSVEVTILKSGASIDVDLDIEGWVKVICDRCLGDLEIPIETSPRLSVKFGEHDSAGEAPEGERELIFLPGSSEGLNLGQVVYDYTLLSLPLRRVHADGECDPDTVKYLSEDETAAEDEVDTPFASLKGLLQNK